MKQRLLLFLALLLTTFGGARANEVEIGSLEGAENDSYLPMNSLYNYSYTQQIYTADEIGTGGTINSITMWLYGNANLYDMPFDIYMVETDKEAFESTTDWVAVTENDIVYSGTVTVHNTEAEAYTFELSTPFEYSGEGNLVIAFNNTTGHWVGGLRGMVFGANTDPNRAIYARRDDGGAYDPYNPTFTAYATTYLRNVITLDITPAGGSTCAKPENFVVSDITDTGATFTWESEVGSYKFEYKKNADAEWTAIDGVLTEATYELVELTDNTAYQARVKAVCGPESESGWKTISFTTENPCAVPANLVASGITESSATISWTPGYGQDAWTVKYKKTADEEWTETTASGNPTITLEGLDGDTQYDVQVYNECEGSAGASIQFYTAETCPDGKVCIGTGKATNSYLPTSNYYNNSLTQQIYTADEIGDGVGAIMSIDLFKASTSALTRNLDIYIKSIGEKATFDSSTDWIPVTAADLAFSGEVTFGANEWTTIEFNTPFEYNGSNIVIVVDDNTGSWVSGSIPFYVFDATSQAIRAYSDGTNYDPSAPSSYTGTLMNVKNRVRLGVAAEMPSYLKPTGLTASEIGPHSAVLSWTDHSLGDVDGWKLAYKTSSDADFTEVDVTTNPFTLTDLAAETAYTVKVRPDSHDSDEDDDKWSKEITFTTDIACPAPTDVAATHILATTADISWTGNDEATGYNLRYKKGVSIDFDDSSMGEWTTIDADGDGYTWVLGSEAGGVYLVSDGTLANSGHNGSADLVCSGSYSNVSGALTPDNYLVSPRVTLGGSITFWVSGQDADYPAEHFGVAVSTTGNTDPADFTTIAEWTLTADGTAANKQGTWGQFTVDLSAYEGQGYVAIRHFNCTDQFILDLDDIVITGPSGESWTTVEDVTSPYTIEGLESSTAYLVQVQAVNADGESRWAQGSFSTKDPNSTPTELAADVTATTATLGWAGAQDSYNLKYRSAVPQDPSTPATIILTAGDNWGDGSGYQMLLDANATAYGTVIPESGALTSSGDANATVYEEFEYKIPEDADGALDTENIVINNSVTIQIPAGTYDWCITNPTPDDRIWIASSNGNVPGRYDDFVFEPGVTYEFTLARFGDNDGVNLTITRPMGDWVEVNDITDNPYVLTGLTPETDYEWQVQGNLTEGTTEWSEIASFTTLEGANITFAKEGYATYYNGTKDVVLPAGMKAFVVTGGNGDTTLDYVAIADGDLTAATTNLVPADVAVMLQVAATQEDQTITVTLASPTATADFAGTNHLLGSDVDVEETTGLGLTGTREYFYKLNYPADGGEFGWYWGADYGYPFASPAHKAWLVLEDDNESVLSKFALPGHEDTTGILSVAKDTTTAEGWYTISGMKLDKQPTTKGLYIHNGKKVVVE
mgnify:CR=1 FL=1